jgi:hypothetical protein
MYLEIDLGWYESSLSDDCQALPAIQFQPQGERCLAIDHNEIRLPRGTKLQLVATYNIQTTELSLMVKCDELHVFTAMCDAPRLPHFRLILPNLELIEFFFWWRKIPGGPGSKMLRSGQMPTMG